MTAVAEPAPAAGEQLTVGVLRRQIARYLEACFAADGRAGTVALDARLLVAFALGLSGYQIVLADADAVSPATAELAMQLAARRVGGEPVARIVGEKEFWGLTLRLSPATLVPRPETETVVEAALAAIGPDHARRLRILDIGTGSGALLLALLSELPGASGVATDRDHHALVAARDNARRLGLASRSGFVQADWAEAVAGEFDLIVSNPPYVAAREIDGLPVEVRDHDPHLALYGGDDGLDAYRRIIPDLRRLLARGGVAMVEVGAGQAAAVARIGRAHGFATAAHKDLAKIDRVVEFSDEATG